MRYYQSGNKDGHDVEAPVVNEAKVPARVKSKEPEPEMTVESVVDHDEGEEEEADDREDREEEEEEEKPKKKPKKKKSKKKKNKTEEDDLEEIEV